MAAPKMMKIKELWKKRLAYLLRSKALDLMNVPIKTTNKYACKKLNQGVLYTIALLALVP